MPFQTFHKKQGYVYILANQSVNVFYVGVTSDLKGRIWQHREGKGCLFSTKYKTRLLMHYEIYENIQTAIQREKQLKNWKHAWKLSLIKKHNPKMEDLWDNL